MDSWILKLKKCVIYTGLFKIHKQICTLVGNLSFSNATVYDNVFVCFKYPLPTQSCFSCSFSLTRMEGSLGHPNKSKSLSSFTTNDLCQLFKIQKKIIQIITNKTFREHCTPLFIVYV